MFFKNLGLKPGLVKAVERSGFKEPTEIQRQAMPVVLKGKDLMASAQTGTGKTAAFALPGIQNLLLSPANGCNNTRMLVLAPTRELAMQVNDCIRQFTRFTELESGLIVGGMSYGPQRKMLKNGTDILVATPGRLKDHMEQGLVNFKKLEVLVLDEADRMLDMGFIRDIKKIASTLPKNRQTLLFSATLEGSVLKVARELLNNPEQISLTSNTRPHESISQSVHHADNAEHKHHLLTHQLSDVDLNQAVIFTRTKHGADKLARKLSVQKFKCAALHGNMSQGKRKRTVDDMKKGKFKYLVATDVAARGLDIDGISHVINFDMPMVAEDYIHRIGRTGRAGSQGKAISLVNRDDQGKLRDVQRLTGQKIVFDVIEGLEPEQNPTNLDAPRKDSKRGAKKPFRGSSKKFSSGFKKRSGKKVPATGAGRKRTFSKAPRRAQAA